MPNSRLYAAMGAQLTKLSEHYMDFARDPLGNYDDRQLSAGAAYTIFAHAEIENFLESWAGRFVDRAEARWKIGRASRVLLHLISFIEAQAVPSEIPLKDIWKAPGFVALSRHRHLIEKNHGIAEKFICKLFAPIGFDLRGIDPILIGDMNAFAQIRGQHALKSYKVHLGQSFDPFDRQAKVAKIFTLLADLDGQLLAYLTLN
jgi:hypothetical protein